MCRQYRYYWCIGSGVCGVFCLYAEESWWRNYSGEEARLDCEREREMEGSHCVGVWPGWIALEKERDHAWMYTIAKI